MEEKSKERYMLFNRDRIEGTDLRGEIEEEEIYNLEQDGRG